MAHPSRLMVIDTLADGEKRVCELRNLIGSDISTVLKCLYLMKEAAIAADCKVGQWVLYSLRVPCITIFGYVQAVMKANAEKRWNS
ncbi:MAG: ArsR family transcriptional regulator [Armatimonadota bacterium]|nr:ArsR family transcriptional regulator [Armatimonadota bacterium]